jgi:hypothetical protein
MPLADVLKPKKTRAEIAQALVPICGAMFNPEILKDYASPSVRLFHVAPERFVVFGLWCTGDALFNCCDDISLSDSLTLAFLDAVAPHVHANDGETLAETVRESFMLFDEAADQDDSMRQLAELVGHNLTDNPSESLLERLAMLVPAVRNVVDDLMERTRISEE